MPTLAKANLLLFGLLIAHLLDHAFNQPTRDLPATGSAVAVIGFAIVAASTVLAVRRSPLAAAAAVVAGIASALGFAAIHLVPEWSEPISDPYWDFSANALSWALVIAPIIAALALAALGLRAVRRSEAKPRRAAVEAP
jgi:hypothetical protein